MRQHRLYFSGPLALNTRVTVQDNQAHYLTQVLRLRPGDEVVLFNNGDHEFVAQIDTLSRKAVALRITDAAHVDTESALHITLIQSLIRKERFDFCIQKATELGVNRIVPVITERTTAKLPSNRVAKRVAHWQGIAVSACEQSGRSRIPVIAAPTDLEAAIAQTTQTQRLVLDPWSTPTALSSISRPTDVSIAIGPEGGFSPDEVNQLKAHGAATMTLGPRVLRSETAGIVAVALCQQLWGDLAPPT
ncbi:MAG: 16S rRNA (uracil(1498)-N(3))-methyltransferase [Pseudomonadota bacterium]